MFSGLISHNNKVEGFYKVPNPGWPHMVDLLKDAGYYGAIRGKVTHSTPYQPYDWDDDLTELPNGKKAHQKDAKSYGESTARGIANAKKQEKPFFLSINISDPHKPFWSKVKGGGEDPYIPSRIFTAEEVPIPGFLFDDPEVREELALYYSSVRRADDCLGEILKALRKSGEWDNTMIVFLSDHGMPLPFAKTQLYHHSTRTPLMVRIPGVTKAGKVDKHHMVSVLDLLPTVLDALKVEQPSRLDGRSFYPVLKGEKQKGRDFVIKQYHENSGRSRDPMRAIQTKTHLYLFNPWSNGERVFATATNGTVTCKRMIALAEEDEDMNRRLELYRYRVPEELYKVKKDPDRRATLHMRQQFKGEGGGNLGDRNRSKDNLFQEGCFLAGRAGRARQRIIDQEIQRCRAMRMIEILDLRDDFSRQGGIIYRLWLKPLGLALFDLFQIGSKQRHFVPHEGILSGTRMTNACPFL